MLPAPHQYILVTLKLPYIHRSIETNQLMSYLLIMFSFIARYQICSFDVNFVADSTSACWLVEIIAISTDQMSGEIGELDQHTQLIANYSYVQLMSSITPRVPHCGA